MLKTLTILAVTLTIISVAQAGFDDEFAPFARRGGHGGRGGNGGGGRGGNGGRGGGRGNSNSGSNEHHMSAAGFLAIANQTVQAIVSAESTVATAIPLFDLQPLIVRFYELNTTRIRALWDATSAFLNNQTNFTWATLPQNVRDELSLMKDTNAFINTPLSDLGLVSASDPNAAKTIYSMLSANCQSLANSLVNMTSGLHFNTTIDLNTLYTAFAPMHRHFSYQFSGQRSFHQSLFRHRGNWQNHSASSPTARLYAYLSNPSANRNCLLSDPMYALNELVEHCQ